MMLAQSGQQIQHQHIKHTATLYCVCMANNLPLLWCQQSGGQTGLQTVNILLQTTGGQVLFVFVGIRHQIVKTPPFKAKVSFTYLPWSLKSIW